MYQDIHLFYQMNYQIIRRLLLLNLMPLIINYKNYVLNNLDTFLLIVFNTFI